MSKLVINDLPKNVELDRAALKAVIGGKVSAAPRLDDRNYVERVNAVEGVNIFMDYNHPTDADPFEVRRSGWWSGQTVQN